jgi:hypothetical protein
MSSKYGLQRHTDSSLKSRQIEEREGVHYLLAQRASEREARKGGARTYKVPVDWPLYGNTLLART